MVIIACANNTSCWAPDDGIEKSKVHGCRPDQVTDLDEGENKEEDGAQEEGPSAFLRQDGEFAEAYAARIFRRVFTEDIQNVLKMEVGCICITRLPFYCSSEAMSEK